MSTNSTPSAYIGALLEDAIALILLDEMSDQRYTATEIQKRSGVKPRSWANYYVNRSREIPTWAWVATAEALGIDPVDLIRRARMVVDILDDTQAELIAGLTGRTRVDMLRQITGGGAADPRGRSRADQDDGVRRVS